MNINILVVEDEISVNKHISEFISDLGSPYHLIGSAANGIQALDFFKNVPVHIVLLDIRMPQMGGLELMEIIMQKWPQTKVIIISGYDDFKYAQKALQLGGVDYLLKPLKQEQLISRLVKVASSLYNGASVYPNLLMNQEKWDMQMIQQESELFDQVELGNVQGAERSIDQLLTLFMDKVGYDHLRLIPFITDSLVALNKRISTLPIEPIRDYLESRWQELQKVLLPHRSFENIESNVKSFVVYCAELVHKFRKQTSPDVLHRCQDILIKHYSKEITLEDMAHLLSVTPSYLSRLFKKEFGVNYTEYLNQLRINKAKELLLSPHLKVMEIASMVGYNNAHYFSKMFKRYAGMTPQEYRDCGMEIS